MTDNESNPRAPRWPGLGGPGRALAVPDPAATHDPGRAVGVAAAVGAFVTWGLFPLYFIGMGDLPALEILAYRLFWSLPTMILVVFALQKGRALIEALKQPKTLAVLFVTTLLIAVNWGVYIYATTSGQVLAASLGYYINPLVNMALGVVILGERLTRRQTAAIALAAVGVGLQVVAVGALPWISLVLALTFGFYGLLRKRADADPVAGLTVEVTLVFPMALVYLAWIQGGQAWSEGAGPLAYLALAGPLTAAPLLLFAVGARRLMLSTVGAIQFIGPTLQFSIGVATGERVAPLTAFAFVFIWAGFALYVWDARRKERELRRARRAESARAAAA